MIVLYFVITLCLSACLTGRQAITRVMFRSWSQGYEGTKVYGVRNRLCFAIVTIFLVLAFESEAQKTKSKNPSKKTTVQKTSTKKPSAQKTPIKKQETQSVIQKSAENSSTTGDEQKVRDIVAFLEYALNTIGSNATPTRDKDILITESYSKIFRDAKVQVEDDLDEERDVITNKDIVAYLKDVDFFFNDVKFEFTIEHIDGSTLPDGHRFYKVSLSRNIAGTTAEGKPVNNTMPRFIEINYNPEDQDLKIVSIYTNEFDEKEALTNWWKELSYEWRGIFKRKLSLQDSVQLSDIKNIISLTELDLSSNTYIQSIEPLAQLLNLKLLDLSRTNITDLTSIRNLTELVELNLSNTKIQDLLPLKYSSKLLRLNISQTEVNDISVVEKMLGLQNLEMNTTKVTDFAPLTDLVSLSHLDISGNAITDLTPLQNLIQLIEFKVSNTPIQDLNPVKNFKNLQILNIDSTRIQNFVVLSNLENLNVLHANYTLLSDLQSLQKLAKLERIYCDHTPITRDKADAFMTARPKVLVIFDSKDLMTWWSTLSLEWQNVLSKTAKVSSPPSKEELVIVTNLDSINVGGNSSVIDLEVLRKLQKVQVIIANKTAFKDLSPLQDHKEIRLLDISDTEVKDLSVVGRFTKLKELRADRTKIESIDPLQQVTGLEKLYADQTFVVDINAREFLEKNPKTLIVYKTIHLNRWWKNLSGNWKDVFRTLMGSDTTSTRENLHSLVERESLHFKDVPVSYLSELTEFVRLKELHFSGTAITAIPALENITSLKSLHATNSPIQKIEALTHFTDLEDLDISNTPVDDLKPVGSLKKLKQFNCSGTQIKKLDALERLETLESLDFSNTKVGNLDPVNHLPLKTLKCYNTKISSKEIEKFKDNHKDCTVVYYR